MRLAPVAPVHGSLSVECLESDSEEEMMFSTYTLSTWWLAHIMRAIVALNAHIIITHTAQFALYFSFHCPHHLWIMVPSSFVDYRRHEVRPCSNHCTTCVLNSGLVDFELPRLSRPGITWIWMLCNSTHVITTACHNWFCVSATRYNTEKYSHDMTKAHTTCALKNTSSAHGLYHMKRMNHKHWAYNSLCHLKMGWTVMLKLTLVIPPFSSRWYKHGFLHGGKIFLKPT